MKKIALLLVCAFSVFAFAQKAPVNKTVGAKQNVHFTKDFSFVKTATPQNVLPAVTAEKLSTVQRANETVVIDRQKPVIASAEVSKTAKADPFYALFYKPEGTFFCGIDETGSYLWFNVPSVVGAWRNGLTDWTYTNASQGADKIQWYSRLYNRIPQYFGTNENGDLIDSTMQLYSWGGYPNLPALYAAKDQAVDSFVLLGYPNEPIDTTIRYTYAWNGVLNPLRSSNGTFPLTNAMTLNALYGTKYSSMCIWDTDTATKSWSYLYGTEPLQYNDTLTVEAAGLLVFYEKPQSPLFIKEISVAVNAVTYVADSADFYYTRPNFNQLGVQILSADLKNVLAQSICTIADTTNNQYFPGSLIHFSFEEKDEYGMITKEGITIKEPFVVYLAGLSQANANFGIVASYNPYYSANTYVINKDGNLYKPRMNADPYIMLNGAFYTMEDYSEVYGVDNYEGDTINMIVKHDATYGVYYLIHADGDFKGYTNQVIAASEMLYDTTTYYYNYNIIAPEWANNIAMEWEVPNGSGTLDLWENYNAYLLYIEGVDEYMEPGTELPKVGDEIILSKYGRELVFKIVEVPDAQGIESVNDNKTVKTNKIIRDGQLIIERNGIQYNAVGTKF